MKRNTNTFFYFRSVKCNILKYNQAAIGYTYFIYLLYYSTFYSYWAFSTSDYYKLSMEWK